MVQPPTRYSAMTRGGTARRTPITIQLAGSRSSLLDGRGPSRHAGALCRRKPHNVSEKYYFARGPQPVNRVVDIRPTFENKLACLRACRPS